jgi:hypothetical protein
MRWGQLEQSQHWLQELQPGGFAQPEHRARPGAEDHRPQQASQPLAAGHHVAHQQQPVQPRAEPYHELQGISAIAWSGDRRDDGQPDKQ